MKIKEVTVVSKFFPPNFVGGGEISSYLIAKELSKKIPVNLLSTVPFSQKDHNFFSKVETIDLSFLNERLSGFENLYFKLLYQKFKNIIGKWSVKNNLFWATDYFSAYLLRDYPGNKIVTVRDLWPICPTSWATSIKYDLLPANNLIRIFKSLRWRDTNTLRKPFRFFAYLYNAKPRRSVLKNYSKIVYISNFLKNTVNKELRLDQSSQTTTVIYNPVGQEFLQRSAERKRIRKNILFVGTLKTHKGLEVLLRALNKTTKTFPNLKLTIIGSGQNLNKYKKMSQELKIDSSVNFEGKVSPVKIVDYFDQADVVVVPSLCHEGMGRTVAEAMARGCLPIASNKGALKEIIKNKKTGYLFEAGNEKSLAKLIESLYNEPDKIIKLGEQARKEALIKFNPDKIGQKYLKFFTH